MTGYTRTDTINNIADGNIINAADFDGEFDAIDAAFNSSTGHVHDGTAANGAPITKIGPTQDVVASATILRPKTTATVDIGSSALRFKDFFFSGAGSITGTITAGAFSGPINGTVGATTPSTGAFTTLSSTGNTTIGDAVSDTITVNGQFVTGTVLRSAQTATNTLALAAYDVDGTAYVNLITLTASNTPTLALTSTGVGTINNMSVGATTTSTGAFTTLSASGVVTLSSGATIQGLTVGKGGGGIGSNTAIGINALSANTSGSANVAVGNNCVQLNTTGIGNTAVGDNALASSVADNYHTAIGWHALQNQNVASNPNTAIGANAQASITTGGLNVSVGNDTLYSCLTGNSNTALGNQALYNTTGSNNIAVGPAAGNAITTGSNNVVIGGYLGAAAPISATGSNYIVLSDGAGTVRQTIDSSGNVSFTGGITPRVVVIADAASITINTDTTDIATQANTQAVGTLTVNAPTGTAVNGQKLILRLRSTNVQTFAWNAVFAGSTDIALPTVSSGATLYDYVGFIYNSTAAKWQMIAKVFGF